MGLERTLAFEQQWNDSRSCGLKNANVSPAVAPTYHKFFSWNRSRRSIIRQSIARLNSGVIVG